ncbi:response regulator [Devosia soli]|nr:response regulator [Devosia soli]
MLRGFASGRLATIKQALQKVRMRKPSILIAEDEPLIAILLQDGLEYEGYTATVAKDGDEAIALLEERPESFDLLLTDIRMPGKTNGWSLARHARSLLPNLPVIYMTGDSVQAKTKEGVPKSVMCQKPVSTNALLEIIGHFLNARGGLPNL